MATADDLQWQPVMDFDKDGCYNVAAIDGNGNVARGLPHNWVSTSQDCRSQSDLQNNNVYSRRRCNNGWCAYLYDYYFEKDVAFPHFVDPGHTHDWEHVVVWVKDGAAQYVAVSRHGGYDIRSRADLGWEGTHPKVVYHKDGGGTHAMRFATARDDNVPENHLGIWFRGDLVSFDGYPNGIRDILLGHNFDKAHMAIKDSSFSGNLGRAKPSSIIFDVNWDDVYPPPPGQAAV